MLAFFRRLLSQPQIPDVSVLQAKLQTAARECDFWHGLYLEEKKAKKTSEQEREQERTRNRLREDDLLNIILRLSNQPFPREREESTTSQTETETASGDDQLLADRAADYCLQAYGEEYTTEQFDTVGASMKNNPSYWLSN